jgi:hypothetical protein
MRMTVDKILLTFTNVVIVFHARNLVFNGIICHFDVRIRIMSTNSKYQIIFNKIASIQCSDEQIDNIKSRYTSEINSKRRLCRIRSLAELLEILEKRDYLNPNNTDPLMQIAVYFGESSVISLLKDYHNKNVVENVSPSRDNHGQCSGTYLLFCAMMVKLNIHFQFLHQCQQTQKKGYTKLLLLTLDKNGLTLLELYIFQKGRLMI